MGMDKSMVFGPPGKRVLIFDYTGNCYTGNGRWVVFLLANGRGDQRRPIEGHEAGAWKGKPRSSIQETIRRESVGANFLGIGHLRSKNLIPPREQ